MDGMAVGIIGAGWIAQQHHRILGSLAGAEVVAVCDVDRERAEALASGSGAREPSISHSSLPCVPMS